MSKEKIPDWIISDYGSARRYKAAKRKQLKLVLLSLQDLGLGCAYTPAMPEIVQAKELLKLAKDKMSVRKWGR